MRPLPADTEGIASAADTEEIPSAAGTEDIPAADRPQDIPVADDLPCGDHYNSCIRLKVEKKPRNLTGFKLKKKKVKIW